MSMTKDNMKIFFVCGVALCLCLVVWGKEPSLSATTHDLVPNPADESTVPTTPYMGGPVELATAPNGAIANKRILDGAKKVAWLEPTIEQPVKGIRVFGG